MLFTLLFVLSFVISLSITALLLKILKPMLYQTVCRIIEPKLSQLWFKYVQIALMIIGLSAGINTAGIKETQQKYLNRVENSQLPELLITHIWNIFKDSCFAIIVSVVFIFFIYLIVYYVNHLYLDKPDDLQNQLNDKA